MKETRSKNTTAHLLSAESVLNVIREINPVQDARFSKLNDICTARLFSVVYEDVLRFNTTAKEWFYYDGSIWARDEGAMRAEALAKQFSDALFLYAHSVDDDQYRKYVAALGDRRRRVTLLQDARDQSFVNSNLLDAQQNYINVRNGVIDLDTWEFLDHSPDQLLSKICNCDFVPDAKSEDWEKFVDEVMCHDEEKKRYLQKVLGYSITAEVGREEFYLHYGSTTRNGKSTALETIGKMLGTYSLTMDVNSLANTQRDSRQASGDIARLKDARFVVASEPPKKMILNVQMLKCLTGRDKITARHLNEREIEFYPVFKLHVNANYLPVITDKTLFTSERVKVISWDRHFETWEQDRHLKDRLQRSENLSGVLRWCLDGLRMYQEEGLEPPQCVIVSTDNYKEISDKIGQFISENLIPSTGNIPLSSLYQIFVSWCQVNNYGTDSKKSFKEELKSRNMIQDTATVNGITCHNVIVGFRINDSEVGDFTPCEASENPFK